VNTTVSVCCRLVAVGILATKLVGCRLESWCTNVCPTNRTAVCTATVTAAESSHLVSVRRHLLDKAEEYLGHDRIFRFTHPLLTSRRYSGVALGVGQSGQVLALR